MKISHYIFLSFLLILLLFSITTYINFRQSEEVKENAEFVSTSSAIVRNAARLQRNTLNLVSGLRAGLALSVVGVLVGEVLGARAGVGYVLNYVYGLLRTPEYVALVVIVAAVVLAIDGAAGMLEARAKRWAG